ncbi:MAG: serine/threonine-protein kinase [Myxococcota bacterium]
MELEPGAIVDRYSIVGVLGHGGMASVYHVRHTRLSSDHVLKVISLPGRGIRERLLLEGQVQARLKHRNVVEVTDVIDIQGSPGLVMELVRGPSLDDVLAATQLPIELVEQLVPGILAGVAAAHAEGVVHRDLKPANILLSVKRGQVVPKVADFGLVKMLDDDTGKAKTRTGTTMGTPQYMAPEQIQSAKDVDARADVFALGAILYELVSGRRAFEGDTHYEIFQKVVSRTYPPLTDLRPDAPERMVRAIDAALSEHEHRPPTPEALWELWRAGDESLEHAATRSGEWPEPLLEQLTELAPSVVTLGLSTSGGASSGPGPRSGDPASGGPTSGSGHEGPPSSDTYFADDGGPDITGAATVELEPRPVGPVSIPGSGRRGPVFVGAIAVVLILLGVGLIAGAGALGGAFYLTGAPVQPSEPTPPSVPSPPEVPKVDPEPQVPDPVPEPTTPPTEPDVPLVGPEPDPRPSPKPGKGKSKGKDKDKDKPSPTPTPTPVPAAGNGDFRVAGGVPVVLTGSDNVRHSPGSIPAGTYRVSATFPSGSMGFGSVTIRDGELLTITCQERLNNCSW